MAGNPLAVPGEHGGMLLFPADVLRQRRMDDHRPPAGMSAAELVSAAG